MADSAMLLSGSIVPKFIVDCDKLGFVEFDLSGVFNVLSDLYMVSSEPVLS